MVILSYSLLDNNKPSVTSTTRYPLVGLDNVDLTCNPDTTDAVQSFEWYKNNGRITGAVSKIYRIPGNQRSNSGSYQCKVIATNISPMSDAKTVTFLGKFVS